jgi:LmbE family N-acetylglucosaminyl deacetylase
LGHRFMLTIQCDRLTTILCLGAHADDIEVGCGGTMLRLLSEHPGLRVVWVVFSARGSRNQEAVQSAESFLEQAGDVQVLVKSHRDGYFPAHYARIKDEFFEIRERCRPDLVFTHRLEDRHQDHRLLAELTWNTFREQGILEYEVPKYEGDLGQPNVFVPLTEVVCRRKVDLLWQHFQSQHSKPWFVRETFWSLLRLRGMESKAEESLAEAFHCQKILI